MNSKVVTIVFIAVCLVLLLSVGGSFWDGSIELLWHGPKSWLFPETLFIFWLGMSQAGILLSVFLLIMNVKIHRRTSLLLELSSVCCLVVPFAYWLFYSDSITVEGNALGVGIVGFISLLYFGTHLVSADSAEDLTLCKELSRIRRPLAWITLPTVFWVFSTLSLDYTHAENSLWHGAFFPLYANACIFYSGIALLTALLSFENYYNRLMEKFLLLCSWFMAVFFLWVYFLKGETNLISFVFTCVVPQILFVEAVRENLWGRLIVALSILLGVLLKVDFVINSNETILVSNLTFAHVSLLFAGLVLFIVFFLGVRYLLSRFFENDEILMGEECDTSDGEVQIYSPFSAPDFKVVRLPVLCGILTAVAFGYFTSDWIVLAGPFGAYVSCLLVCLQPFTHLVFFKKRRGGKSK